MDQVDQALREHVKIFRAVALWFSGSQVQECWLLLRKAEEGLLLAADGQGLRVRAEAALSRGVALLGGDSSSTTSGNAT